VHQTFATSRFLFLKGALVQPHVCICQELGAFWAELFPLGLMLTFAVNVDHLVVGFFLSLYAWTLIAQLLAPIFPLSVFASSDPLFFSQTFWLLSSCKPCVTELAVVFNEDFSQCSRATHFFRDAIIPRHWSAYWQYSKHAAFLSGLLHSAPHSGQVVLSSSLQISSWLPQRWHVMYEGFGCKKSLSPGHV